MKYRRVVITGLGIVAPNGIGKEAFWESLLTGRSGISRVSRFDVTDLPTQIAGEIKDLRIEQFIEDSAISHMSLPSKFGIVATKLALEDAGWGGQVHPERCGCIVGTSNPSHDFVEEQINRMARGESLQREVIQYADLFSTASYMATRYHLSGMAKTISTSCTSGIHSIGLARDLISSGDFDFIVAGSTESAISPYSFRSFCASGMMSKRNEEPSRASRPFDAHRDGGVVAEGAAFVVMEAREVALQRGAHIYGEIIGYSESAQGTNIHQQRRAMPFNLRGALESAFLSPSDIDYFCAHAPSDPITDRLETEAIKEVFGDHAYRMPVSSIKALTGNALSSSGVMQVIASCLAIQTHTIPPTWNYEFPDPLCDLDYVPNEPRRNQCNYVMVNSHGYLGTDACIIIGRFED